MLVPSEPGVFLWTDAMLTAERARELLSYDPETGWLTWRITKSNRNKAGNRAGNKSNTRPGYFSREVCIDGMRCREHRVIWLIATGVWPENEIDHVNHDATDNRWVNLREATREENAKNQTISSRSTTGVCGVSWYQAKSKFQAYININRKRVHLGNFKNLDDAILARKNAEAEYGYHKNHGASN